MTTPKKPRSARPDPAPDTFAARVRDTMHRLHLDEREAADYLGVPVFTLRKWATGERQPGAAVLRLFEILGMVEALAPALHESFCPRNRVMSKNPVPPTQSVQMPIRSCRKIPFEGVNHHEKQEI